MFEHTCACFAGLWVHVCHGTYMEPEDSSQVSIPPCRVRVSLVSTALHVPGYDPQPVLLLLCLGYRCVTAHLTVSMGSGHWIWIVRLAWQVLLPAKPPPHLPFGAFLLVSYCLQQRGLKYFGYKH